VRLASRPWLVLTARTGCAIVNLAVSPLFYRCLRSREIIGVDRNRETDFDAVHDQTAAMATGGMMVPGKSIDSATALRSINILSASVSTSKKATQTIQARMTLV
jgi:hypothetical protein